MFVRQGARLIFYKLSPCRMLLFCYWVVYDHGGRHWNRMASPNFIKSWGHVTLLIWTGTNHLAGINCINRIAVQVLQLGFELKRLINQLLLRLVYLQLGISLYISMHILVQNFYVLIWFENLSLPIRQVHLIIHPLRLLLLMLHHGAAKPIITLAIRLKRFPFFCLGGCAPPIPREIDGLAALYAILSWVFAILGG